MIFIISWFRAAYYPAACLYRFFLERDHQVHDLAWLRAAIK